MTLRQFGKKRNSVTFPTNHTTVIVGAGYSGVATAQQPASRGCGKVVLVSPNANFVDRIRLHQYLAGSGDAEHDLKTMLHPAVRLVVGSVEQIDTGGKSIQVCHRPQASDVEKSAEPVDEDTSEEITSEEITIQWDSLIIATGVMAVPPIGTFDIGDLAQCQEAKRILGTIKSGGVVTVCGAGATGIEVAAELAFARPDLRIRLIGPTFCSGVGPRAQRHIKKYMAHHKIDYHCATVVSSGPGWLCIRQGPDQLSTPQQEQSPETTLASDLSLWCGPFTRPSPAVAAAFNCDEQGRVSVDQWHRPEESSDVRIVGDAAIRPGPSRMSCQSALPTGVDAADALVASVVGGSSRGFTQRFVGRNISLGRRDAVVQPGNRDDVSVGPAVTGFLAVKVKEAVCQMVLDRLASGAEGRPYRAMR